MADKKKLKFSIKLIILLVKMFFSTQKHFVKFRMINYPKQQCLFSIWHGEQCVVYSVKDKEKFYVLISPSNDGEIVAQGIEVFNMKSIRGSSKRHAVKGSLEIVDKLNEGNSVALMVDGPKGPKGKVKEGIVNLAKLSGVPIVPVSWQSKDKTFLKFNSWDEFRVPFGYCRTVVSYGEPIFIPKDIEKEEVKLWCEKVENAMEDVRKDLEENYDTYLKTGEEFKA